MPLHHGFRTEFLDFQRGIQVGHLEPHQRITQILKLSLEENYRQPFVTDRWGRGVYWQWICFLPKANRAAKPISSHVNFGCSKFFVMIDRDQNIFKSGFQVERGFIRAPKDYRDCQLRNDWDWHRLIRALEVKSGFYEQLRRLVQTEGFRVHGGSWDVPSEYIRSNFPSRRQLLRCLNRAQQKHWSGFQVYYPMTAEEVQSSTGADLVEAVLAVFREVTPLMNQCMQIVLEPR
jgi:hypothetical protein